MSSLGGQSKLTSVIVTAGFILGLFLSWGLLSGDQQGRVNVLQLVAIYIFLPIISLLFSSISLLIGKSWNFAKLITLIPLWSGNQRSDLLRLLQKPHAKLIFFYQSQLAALSFSLASLIVLFLLLISSDVNFIWRSTLLSAEQIYWLLEWLATPWQFWPSAQPNLELLQTTQDTRLIMHKTVNNNFGAWWQFILAAQIFYAFLLRFVSILGCKFYSKVINKQPQEIKLVRSKPSKAGVIEVSELAPVVNQVDSGFALTNWGGLKQQLLQKIQKKLQATKRSELSAGPLASHAEQMVAERWQETQLLIVKGWEPPLAELADFMQNGKGYLLPLDWSDDGIQPLSKTHLDEWRRFILQLPSWQLLQLDNP